MKSIYLILIILGITLFIPKGNAQENNDSTYYFLLDRNTKLITYYEKFQIRKGKQGTYRSYHFLSEIDGGDPMYASLFHLSEAHPTPHKTLVKPLEFLDSIHYYDEKWLTETVSLMYTYRLYKYTLYVIDKATIKNDSVTLYQVDFMCDGRE